MAQSNNINQQPNPGLTSGPDDKTKNYVDDALKDASQELRKDFMAIFGIFAAFLTLTVVQIGVLVQKTTMSLTMGAMSFFLGSSLTFILALQYLVGTKKLEKRDIIRLVLLSAIIAAIFFFSFQCFWYATHNRDLWG